MAAVSSAAGLIRLAEAPALTVAAYRMALASAVVVPLALLTERRARAALAGREWVLLGASALFLALHFAFWIASLSYTSVASSVVIVTANPLFVALASAVLLKEGVSPRVLLGVGLGLGGGVLIGWGDWRGGREAFLGDGLALLGSLAATGYYVVGRRLRPRLPLLAYIAPVYGMAALLLVGASLVGGVPLAGFGARTYVFLALVGLVPQVIGHSALNWALGHLAAPLVAVAVMAEPVVATLLAWLVLAEAPPGMTLAGGALILAGVFLALRG